MTMPFPHLGRVTNLNTLKTVFGSIHSKKAVEEMDKLGVSVYKFSEDGTRQFRDVQDVILDLMVATQGTTANLEEMFKAASGGKFQWAKASAMFGDYKEFISAWGKAVDATGFTTEQIKMQMDTIARKIETLKADMEGLVVSGGNNTGFTQFLKFNLDALDNVIVALKKVPKEAYVTAEVLGFLTLTVYGVSKACDALTLSMSAMGKTKVGFALSAAVIAITFLLDKFGEMENAVRKSALAMQDEMAVRNQEIESMKQQSQFADALFTSYQKLDGQVANSTEGTEKHTQALENRQATEKELTNILGWSAVERIKQAGWTQEAYEKEKNVFVKNIEEKQMAMFKYRTDRINDLTWTIETYYQGLIDGYYKDAQAYISATKNKMDALDTWEQFQADNSKKEVARKREMLRDVLDKRDKIKEELDSNGDRQVGYTTLQRQYDNLTKQSEDLTNGINSNIDYMNNIINSSDYIQNIKRLQKNAEKEKDSLLFSMNFHPATAGGSDAGETDSERKAREKAERSKAKELAVPVDSVEPTKNYSDLVVDNAQQKLGMTYVLGGDGVTSTDCGKFLLDSWNEAGVEFANRYVPSMIEEAQAKGVWHGIDSGYEPKAGDGVVTNGDGHVVMADGNGGYYGASSSAGQVIHRNNLNEAFDITGYISLDELTGGSSPSRATVNTLDKQRKNYRKILKDLDFTKADLTANNYAETLEKLSTRQAIFGDNVELSSVKNELSRNRINELADETKTYQQRIDGLNESMDSIISQNGKLAGVLGTTQEQWNSMSKAERASFKAQRKDLMDNNNEFKDISGTINDYTKKISDANKEIEKLKNDSLKDSLGGILDTNAIIDRKLKSSQHEYKMKSMELENGGFTGNYIEVNRMIKLAEAEQRLALETERLQYLEEQYKLAEKENANNMELYTIELEAKKVELSKLTEGTKDYSTKLQEVVTLEKIINGLRQNGSKDMISLSQEINNASESTKQASLDVDKYKEKWNLVKDDVCDMFNSIIVEGNSFKDVWKKLWNQLASDALKALFRVQNNSQGLLSSVLGLFGGNSGSSGSWQAMGGYTSVTGFFNHKGGEIKQNPKMHSGGRVMLEPTLRDDEVNRTLQVGERVLSKKDNQMYEQVVPDLVRYAATVPKGTQIEPVLSNPNLMQPDTFKSAEVKINSAMTAQLERQNVLMEQQNTMLASMGEGKGNVVVLNTQADSASVMKALQENPRAVQAILGGQRKMGFR